MRVPCKSQFWLPGGNSEARAHQAVFNYSSPKYPAVPFYGPQPNAPYMVDNTDNYYHVAPDKGKQNGPSWPYSGSLNKYMSNLKANKIIRSGFKSNLTQVNSNITSNKVAAATCDGTSSYWLTQLGPLGSAPLAGSDYKFYRNIVSDYGADCTGTTDASEAINAAVSDGDRCGEECGNTFKQGAIIYFPPGTYRICTPIIQLYYTQFIGDALNPPTIQGCSNFSGIALFDTDPYIPGASGEEWYVNQNQFLRQIRNFIFDLTLMPMATDNNDQPLVPTGIHWQVAQGTSLQNLVFNMPKATSSDDTTAVGIFSENGSGGFVSDLTFNGGNIGWRAGSQQYTARNVKFNDCLTAVQMVWDWGWTWQGVEISGGAIGFNISGVGGNTGQGIGSVSIIDSAISDVPVGILTNSIANSPNIVLDNVDITNVDKVVQVENGDTLLTASDNIDIWTTGRVYNGSVGTDVTGETTVPPKAKGLLSKDGRLFVQSRPQYESFGVDKFSVATTDGGCKNDGTGDQTSCINTFLQKASSSDLIAYFPAGIYQVGGTILIPTGSRVQGSSWSQIQGSGYYFSDMSNPKVMVQVGNAGEVGSVEIVEMLFSVRGNTAGAILMEWNTAAVTQGAAAMWDSHFRVGGADGTDLGIADCPKFSFNEQCIAASLMFHVTKQASGYFENVWAWVADHDNDENMYNQFDKTANQISVYGARGMLIESQGPSWFYGTSSEHSVMYNYQVSGAKDIYMGHIQTETPYYQPNPIAPAPFDVDIAKDFPNDPDFSKCHGDTACAASWGLRVVDSSSVTIHGAGLYSFFQEYYQDCVDTFNCQQRVLEVTGSTGVVIFNLYTVAISEIAVGIDNTVVFQNDTNQSGFTTEDSIWLPLPGQDNVDTVYVGTEIWSSPTVSCSHSSCLLVFPTSPLKSSATVTDITYKTSVEYGHTSTVTVGGIVTVTFVTTVTTTVITVTGFTISAMGYSNYNITSGETGVVASPSIGVPDVTISVSDGDGGTTSRVLPLPPWPQIIGGPTDSYVSPDPGNTGSSTYYQGVTSTVTVSGSTVTTVTFPATIPASTITCPPDSEIVFATPAVTFVTDCSTLTTIAVGFNCPTTKVITFLGATTGLVSVDCSLITSWTAPPTTTPPTTTSTTVLPVWTTWPPGIIYPITTTVTKPEPTGGGSKQPCTLWFFFICISHDKIHIGGWFWSFPPGIYPPGPPPPIQWPPGFKLEGSLPPWPEITIGPDHQPTYSSEPPDESCKTETASICSTTVTYLVTTTDGTTSTTATSTISDCESVYGCDVTYSGVTSRTTSVAVCTPSATNPAKVRRSGNEITDEDPVPLRRREDNCVDLGAIVYPHGPRDVGGVPSALQRERLVYQTIGATHPDNYVAYYWVQSLPESIKSEIETFDLADAYYYPEYNHNSPRQPQAIFGLGREEVAPAIISRESLSDVLHNISRVEHPPPDKRRPWARAATTTGSDIWNTAFISLPPNKDFSDSVASGSKSGGLFQYYYDDSAGEGITVYTPGDGDIWTDHPEFAENTPTKMQPQSRYGYIPASNDILRHHGSAVVAAISGTKLGVCKKCHVVFSGHQPPTQNLDSPDDTYDIEPRDWFLEDLISAWDNMNTAPRTPATSVISMSFGSVYSFWTPNFIKVFYDILKQMDRAGVTIVVAAGNFGKLPGRKAVDTYPQLFADPNPNNPHKGAYRDPNDPNDSGYLPNMIVVGAASKYGTEAEFSQTASFVTTYAAGQLIYTPKDPTDSNPYETDSGTSFAAPQVAGLAAYLKQLPSQWHDQMNQPSSAGPKAVKAMIVALQRPIVRSQPARPKGLGRTVPLVWNGMIKNVNCLVPNDDDPENDCPNLPDDITEYVPPTYCDNSAVAARGLKGSNSTIFDRQDGGGACVLPPDGGGGVTIGVTTGPTVGPTCASSCGGVLCTGYWCSPQPTGDPPGFRDPKDPNSQGATATPTTIGPGTSTTTTPPTSPPPDTGPPLPTLPPGDADFYCFRDHIDEGNYQTIGVDVGKAAISDVCDQEDVLLPSTPLFAVRGPGSLLVSVSWAKDQTGCPTKQNVPLGTWCTETYRAIIIKCDQESITDTYGGAFIEENSDYGCVTWWIGSDYSTSMASTFAAGGTSHGVVVTDLREQQAIQAMIDDVEPHLSRIVRGSSKE
ncbi:hypothetical protein O988_00131 [Pseudogymnoascus sp. VKM F-3808]|nr:hypothetical protein O988_00131 [Pseudogymnoascus sp. VKM F-3808]